MNILHVNYVDLSGRRFNGYDLMHDLRVRGISGKQAVLTRLSDDADVVPLLEGPLDEQLRDLLVRVEEHYSMNNLLPPWGQILRETEAFRAADAVHYHLIHGGMLSLLDLPELMSAKPSVWTFHDPWPLTGHCVHPPDGCQGWISGCSPCPHLEAMFPLHDDRAGQLWSIKRQVFLQTDVDIVVASDFMLDMVRTSPLTQHLDRVHLVPFGIDATLFLPEDHKAASRISLGIPADDFVLLFRSADTSFKGLSHIRDALSLRRPDRPTTLLTVDQKGLMGRIADDFNIIELGWVEDPNLYPRLFSACDVFLMPSTAESFGLMALEAMAAGRPVVCFAGTAVESVVHAPSCGIAVPLGDAKALRVAVDELAADPAEAARRGAVGRRLAAERYSHGTYLNAMSALYESVVARSAQ